MGKKKTPAPAPVAPTPASTGGGGPYSEVMSGYRQFAETGGFSPEDLANIRARSVSPIRAVYANALQNVNRQRALQGGYSPNYGALTARLAREQSMSQADAAINREAGLAEMVQKGRLAGLGGMLDASRAGGGGGSGGGEVTPEAPKHPKWSMLGKIAKIAAPIALAYFTGGAGPAILAGAGGAAGAAKGGKGKGIGTGSTQYLLR